MDNTDNTDGDEVKTTYLGDGVYGTWDGWHLTLETGSHLLSGHSNTIYLDHSMLSALMEWLSKMGVVSISKES